MFTKYKTKDDKIYFYSTRSLDSGVLCVINDDANTTFYVKNKDERTYHMDLRRKIIKDGGEIITGTVIKNYKGKYKINNFIRK